MKLVVKVRARPFQNSDLLSGGKTPPLGKFSLQCIVQTPVPNLIEKYSLVSEIKHGCRQTNVSLNAHTII
jgi:hypothetical protein